MGSMSSLSSNPIRSALTMTPYAARKREDLHTDGYEAKHAGRESLTERRAILLREIRREQMLAVIHRCDHGGPT